MIVAADAADDLKQMVKVVAERPKQTASSCCSSSEPRPFPDP